MKKIFVAVGTTASKAVIELAKRCRDENLDKNGMLAQDFKYITIDTVPKTKTDLEKLYPNTTRVHGISLTSESKDSPVLESLLAVRGDWKGGDYKFGPRGAYGFRFKSALTRTWVDELKQCFDAWAETTDIDMEVLVVGTACGATCTGMYWDVASCLRSWSKSKTTVCGVVSLPDIDKIPETTDFGLYPIQKNFCAFVQDMRQIAILNSLRKKRQAGFRPVSFKTVDARGFHWEDSIIHLYDDKDAEVDTSRLPVDAMFFLPAQENPAIIAEHLFVYSSIYNYTGPGGQQDVGNVGLQRFGGTFGGLHLAVAPSPLSNVVKKGVQEKWQGIRSSFLKPGERASMDAEDQAIIARLIRPQTDAITPNVENKMKEPSQWFEEWKACVKEGKTPDRLEVHTLKVIMARLQDLIEREAFPAYMDEKPFPLKFFGNAGFIEKIKGNNDNDDNDAWKLVVRETGREVTIQDLKDVYVAVCKEIKAVGGTTPQGLAQKSKEMQEAMELAKDAFETASKNRAAKMAVKAFGQRQRDMVQTEAKKSFEKWADGWFHRLKVIYLMHYLAKQLPGERQLDSEIDLYSNYTTEATKAVVKATPHPALEGRINVTKEDVLSLLLDGAGKGMEAFVQNLHHETVEKKYTDVYDDFVSKRVAEILDKLSKDATFDKAAFAPRFKEPITGFSEVFKRNEADCRAIGSEVMVKHICKHAGQVSKPTCESVWKFSPSFKTLNPDASNSDSFDPFAKGGPRDGEISEEECDPQEKKDHEKDCYFGRFKPDAEVPSTFLRMWLGVLALDKSLPELLKLIYGKGETNLTTIEANSMQAETLPQAGVFVRLINLPESVELGVALGYLATQMKNHVEALLKNNPTGKGLIGGVHLRRKDNMSELVSWNTDAQVQKFWKIKEKELDSIDARTLKNLIEWLREVNVRPEAKSHLRFWNEQDWSPLTSESFVFENESFFTNLSDLEQYLCSQLDVQFDEFQFRNG